MFDVFKLVGNWWKSVPNELDSSINGKFQGQKAAEMCKYIESNAANFVEKAKLEGRAIIIHPDDVLLRSLIVTPKGDFFLLLNRHFVENDKVLGQGATKKVSIALHLNSGEKYASSRCYNLYPEDQKTIDIELSNNDALRSLEGVTNISHVVEYPGTGRFDGIKKVRFFSKLCNEGSLADAIENGKLSEKQKIQVMKDLCSILYEMHQLGVFHRDLKPANILMHDGRPKITDFDTSGKLGMLGEHCQEEVVGTVQYLPPEVVFKDESSILMQDDRADVYSLGVTLLELFGKKIDVNPVLEKEKYHQEVLKAANDLGDDLHAQLIQKMVAIDPDERITSGELAEEVQFLN